MSRWATLSPGLAGRWHCWLHISQRLSELNGLYSLHTETAFIAADSVQATAKASAFHHRLNAELSEREDFVRLAGRLWWIIDRSFFSSFPESCVKYLITFILAVWSLSFLSRTLHMISSAWTQGDLNTVQYGKAAFHTEGLAKDKWWSLTVWISFKVVYS